MARRSCGDVAARIEKALRLVIGATTLAAQWRGEFCVAQDEST
jgi:hypothetical protein